jgi:hypothetical protein
MVDGLNDHDHDVGKLADASVKVTVEEIGGEVEEEVKSATGGTDVL